ncbi:TRAP transporter small permease [Cellulophaga baltica]|uniref:TRAP transporter small permease n=1 Tax=Cellulophaga TaxID=104264 RepID=UPI001C0782C3|nr:MULTISPECIES: TRAP transporter small permease [Cellulophaga]MBU2998012.1 TRAP transporter small permease [Cellulophaga baltica]MDO6769413.1 TRAP transporter small permease [Cellulophaga sp. 1_MG-2023]
MKLRAIIDKILSNVLIVIMSIMVVNVLWQVFSRYCLAEPSSFTDELARYLMIWIGVLGAAYVSGKNNHVAIDVLPSRLSETKQKKLKVFVNVLIILFSVAALVIGGSRLVYITYDLKQFSPALQMPLSLVYLVIPISGVLIIYYKISDLLNS